LAVGGQYDLAGAGFSRKHLGSNGGVKLFEGGALKMGVFTGASTQAFAAAATGNRICTSGSDGKLIQYDPQISNMIDNDSKNFYFAMVPLSQLTGSGGQLPDLTMVKDIALVMTGTQNTTSNLTDIPQSVQGGSGIKNVRRLNQIGTFDGTTFTANPLIKYSDASAYLLAVVYGGTSVVTQDATSDRDVHATFVQDSKLNVVNSVGDALTVPAFESNFGTSPSPTIPEIDIKIESIAVTAVTRKLRARWSPELAQDLNAYHSLDAEVELTQILSEQIALELDREILNDLLTQANGANYYWSRAPGKFINKETGMEVQRTDSLRPGPAFTGTVREWYETLTETIIDVANTIHRKTLRGSANFIVVGPDVATILESSVLYRPSLSIDGDGQVGAPFSIGAEAVGNLSNRFTVYKDPYFPRNKILVGYKGGSYLETGYVYAPYVPLIVTPTIFAPEDFTPRKGVMTRYGKKMVRSDFYGTVTVADMNVI
jgi:hypothetical protein